MQIDSESDFNPILVHPLNPRLMRLHNPSLLTVSSRTKKTKRSGTT